MFYTALSRGGSVDDARRVLMNAVEHLPENDRAATLRDFAGLVLPDDRLLAERLVKEIGAKLQAASAKTTAGPPQSALDYALSQSTDPTAVREALDTLTKLVAARKNLRPIPNVDLNTNPTERFLQVVRLWGEQPKEAIVALVGVPFHACVLRDFAERRGMTDVLAGEILTRLEQAKRGHATVSGPAPTQPGYDVVTIRGSLQGLKRHHLLPTSFDTAALESLLVKATKQEADSVAAALAAASRMGKVMAEAQLGKR